MDDEKRALFAARLAAAQRPPVSPAGALKDFWAKGFTYSGRATPAEYNWPLMMFVVASCVGGALFKYVLPRPISTILEVAVLVVFMVPWFALIARRCHDMNRRGAFGLLLLATGIGFLLAEGFLMFSESDPLGARFEPASSPTE
ncbi:MAG: hypothetical protein JWO79_4341 [Actinomycetia bacterium]|nr:hypothetical protein [Actinomycetes bacterium]